MPIVPTRPSWLTWRTGLLCAPLLLVIWMGVSSYRNLQSFKERVAVSDRVYLVLGASSELLTEFEDAESGQRGFLLTGRESYLAPYNAAIAKVDETFRHLLPTASALPDGLARLARLRAHADAKLGELRLTIDLYHSKGLQAALAVVENDSGLNEMAELRSELTWFIDGAYADRQLKRDASVAATSRTNLTVTLGAIALFLLLVGTTILIERDLEKSRVDALHIQELNRTLEVKVRDRTQALEDANRDLESFSYSVSHDLRAPLRSVDGFAKMLARDYAGRSLDERGLDLMRRMSASTVRMGQLIDDLLNLSRISRGRIEPRAVDLSALAVQVADELAAMSPDHRIAVSIEPDLTVHGDENLLRVALENLFGNVWKFTRNADQPRLGFGLTESPDGPAFFVRDNGVGFEMAHSEQLFVPFQRLHSESEFEGTGIGLATVQRVIHLHGGKIWAESNPGRGATFFFTIPMERREGLDRQTIAINGGGQSGRRAAHA